MTTLPSTTKMTDSRPLFDEFYNIFGTAINPFLDEVFIKTTGNIHLDIAALETKWQIEYGYNMEDGSLADFVQEKWGEKGLELIYKLI